MTATFPSSTVASVCAKCGGERVIRNWHSNGEMQAKLVCIPCARARSRANSAATNHKGKREWDARNKLRRRAHKKIEYALVSGKMERQCCERCGASSNVQAHHDDYSKPLDVMWLCPTHHGERHKELRAAALAASKVSDGVS